MFAYFPASAVHRHGAACQQFWGTLFPVLISWLGPLRHWAHPSRVCPGLAQLRGEAICGVSWALPGPVLSWGNRWPFWGWLSVAGRGGGYWGPWSLLLSREQCVEEPSSVPSSPSHSSCLLESTVGLKIPDLHTVLLPQSCRVHVGIFKFSMKIWASCSSPQDALSHQPSHVPLRSWEMDYFTQAFANDGSNLNLQVGVDGRNSPASVSISSTPPPPASAPHLSSSQKFFCLLWVSVFPNIQ